MPRARRARCSGDIVIIFIDNGDINISYNIIIIINFNGNIIDTNIINIDINVIINNKIINVNNGISIDNNASNTST